MQHCHHPYLWWHDATLSSSIPLMAWCNIVIIHTLADMMQHCHHPYPCWHHVTLSSSIPLLVWCSIVIIHTLAGIMQHCHHPYPCWHIATSAMPVPLLASTAEHYSRFQTLAETMQPMSIQHLCLCDDPVAEWPPVKILYSILTWRGGGGGGQYTIIVFWPPL